MVESSNSYELLSKLTERQSDKRAALDLLLVGFIGNESDSLLSLIRSAGLSPRGRVTHNETALQLALSERSWDLIVSTPGQLSELDAPRIAQIIREQGRDIPIIELSAQSDIKRQSELISLGIISLPKDAEKLITQQVAKEFKGLQERRRLHQLERSVDQLLSLNKVLTEQSSLAIALLGPGKQILSVNPFFQELFGLPQRETLPSVTALASGSSLEHLTELLTQPGSGALKNLELTRQDGSAFKARVHLFEITTPTGVERRLHIDPLSTTVEDQPADFDDRNRFLTQAELTRLLHERINQTFQGMHDAFLLYLSLSSPQTSPEPSADELSQLLPKTLDALERHDSLTAITHLQGSNLVAILEQPTEQSAQETIGSLRDTLKKCEIKGPIRFGLAAINNNAPMPDELLARAIQAAERLPDGATLGFYRDPKVLEMQISAASNDLEDAIRTQRLKLMYQPLVHLDESNTDQHFEVLISMVDKNNQELPAARFLSSLEEANVMVRLDRWVLENALLALKQAQSSDGTRSLFINIARRTLRSKSFIPWLAQQLNELDLSGRSLVMELSETDVAADIDYAKVFAKAARRVGCSVCLKHFGCSTNSAKVFALLKPEFIKLDGSFIRELNQGPSGKAALAKLIQPTRDEKTHIIAPLVEDIGQLGELVRMGIDMVQGYYLQPPQPNMDYEYFEEK